MTSKLSSTHLDKPGGSPALKLPPLFSLTPSSSGKGTQTQKRNALIRQPSQEVTSEEKTLTIPSTKDQMNGSEHGISYASAYPFIFRLHFFFFTDKK
jgi:hypothetical protein